MATNEQFDMELKETLIAMMQWFHQFCVDNDIRYYVVDGTMLGAARHQGFIPWDDDIDVGVPRRDYEKLASILNEKTEGRYVLETPDSPAKEFIYTYSKLYDTTTTLVEHARKDIRRGVFIDIFPLDGIGNSVDESKNNYKRIDFLFKFYMARVVAVRSGRSFYKNAAVMAEQLIPECIINNQKLRRELVAECKKHDFDECLYGGNLLSTWRFREVMERKIMGTPTLYQFENIEVFGVEDYDGYLTSLYGDWRKLPPAEKQVTHHDFVECDLHRSYR